MWYIELSLSHGDRRGECKFSSKYAPRGGWRRGRAPHSNNGVVVEFFSRLMLTSSSVLYWIKQEWRIESSMQKIVKLGFHTGCPSARARVVRWCGGDLHTMKIKIALGLYGNGWKSCDFTQAGPDTHRLWRSFFVWNKAKKRDWRYLILSPSICLQNALSLHQAVVYN